MPVTCESDERGEWRVDFQKSHGSYLADENRSPSPPLPVVDHSIALPSLNLPFSSIEETIYNLSELISYADHPASLVAWGGYSDIHKATLASAPVAVKVIRDVHIAKRDRSSLLRVR